MRARGWGPGQGGAFCEEEDAVVSEGELTVKDLVCPLIYQFVASLYQPFLSLERTLNKLLLLIKVTKSFIVSELTAVRGYWGKKLQIFKSLCCDRLSKMLVQ